MTVTSRYVLELKCSNLGREAGDDADHLPWAQGVAVGTRSATLGLAVMLPESAQRIGCRADVKAGTPGSRPQEVAAVEGRDRLLHGCGQNRVGGAGGG